MIASGIAYFLCAIFAVIGLAGLHLTLTKTKGDAEKIVTYFAISIVFLGAAWGCAYLGGI